MDNQHRQIKGYRELSQGEIDLMNAVKELAAEVGCLVAAIGESQDADKRWVSIAATELQQGFMALTRSIARPDFF